jgi:hypothetical protein
MPEAIVDALEVIDVQDDQRQRAAVSRGAGELSIQLLYQVALVVNARQPIHDGHPIDRLVVLGLEVGATQELEDRIADLDLVSAAKLLVLHGLIVHIRAVRRVRIDEVIAASSDLDARVATRDAVALQDDVVFGAATDPHDAVR